MDSVDPTQKLGNVERSPLLIEVVYAGGTISSIETAEGHREGGHELDLVELLQAHAPELELDIEINEKHFAYTGLSENITHEDQESIAAYVIEGMQNSDGVLVSHGTDSLEQTARLLGDKFNEELKQSGKKVILVAANEDLEHPQTDAWDNLQFGLESFATEVPGGVYVAFHGKLIPAHEVVKQPYVNGVATFVSMYDEQYVWAHDQQQAHANTSIELLHEKLGVTEARAATMQYDVNVLRPNHEDMIAEVESRDVKAIILNLYHSGTANTVTPGQSVVELVEHLREEKGIVFFGVTETGEPTNLRKYETSVKLREAGVVPLYNMLPRVASEKLKILADEEPDVLVAKMLRNQGDEIDPAEIIEEDVVALIELYSDVA